MALIIQNILFAIISIICCVKAPGIYDYNFCVLVFALYLIQNALHFINDKRTNKIGFELFFFISYTFCNFIYPIFYFPTNQYFSLFIYPFNTNVISQATAIAYLGYAFYMLGVTPLLRVRRPEPLRPTFTLEMKSFIWIFIIAMLSFVAYMGFGGWSTLQSVYEGGSALRDVGIFSYFYNIFTIASYLMAIFLFRLKENDHKWVCFGIVGFTILLFLTTGSRSLALGLALVLGVGFHNNIRRFRLIEIVALLVVGILGMYAIMVVRTEGVTLSNISTALAAIKQQNILDIFLDLTINNRNLYVLVDYANSHDLTWFHGMMVDICSPIPGMTGWLVSHFHEPIELLHGGDLPTYLQFGAGHGWGLGTNMTGEAFRSFGYVGTALAMMLIGQIVKSSYYASTHNIYAYTLYYLLVSHAVMYPRGPLIFDPRTIVWSILLLYIIVTINSLTKEQVQTAWKRISHK